jgi:histidinol-phosphate aminotransferase
VSWVTALARPEIAALKPYAHAAWQPELTRLHANELPWRVPGDDSGAGLNRYPEPQPRALIERLATLYNVRPEQVLAARGADEAIDLLIRTFCRAEHDAVLVCPPTFGMYAVAAAVQGAQVVSVPLLPAENFALDERALLRGCTPEVKIVFLCSPNNPTGNLLAEDAILRIAAALEGRSLVVVDEAYVEFAAAESLTRYLPQLPNLAILRTLSKAHGLAGARCGALIAHREVITLVTRIIPPYAITQLTLEAVLRLLEPAQLEASTLRIATLRSERERVSQALVALPGIVRVWPSAANFLLAEFTDPAGALLRAREADLLVRDLRTYSGLANALRITLGTPSQNSRLLEAWS